MKIIYRRFTTALIFSLMLFSLNGQVISNSRITCTIAGNGDPWEVLNDKLENVILALHKGYNVSEIADAYKISKAELIAELEPLVKAKLLTKTKNDYFPNILVVTEEDELKLRNRSIITAQKLSETVIDNWDKIEKAFAKLSLSKTHKLSDQAFMLIGSRLLDIGVLRALVENEELLLPAPNRPTPSHPNGKYYLWIKENSQSRGGYGQMDVELKFDNWFAINFGTDNDSRYELLGKAMELIETGEYESPSHFADLLNVTFLNKDDSQLWNNLVKEISDLLLKDLLKEKDEIEELYNTLKVSKYSKDIYNDFYCCYYHCIYGVAINNLIEKNFINLPQNNHASIILYKNDKGDGVYFE